MVIIYRIFYIILILIIASISSNKIRAESDIYFIDEFNEPTLDINKWESFENNGTILLNSGLLELSSTPYNNFPYVRSVYDPFPQTGDFNLETRIQFPIITAWGIGFLTGTQAPLNEIPFNDPIASRIFTYHTDTSKSTFWFRYLQQNIFNPLAPRDNFFHKINVEYSSGVYRYYFDDIQIFEVSSSFRPHAIFFGSPHNQKVLNSSTPWSSMKLDYIKIIATPSATPTPSPTPTPTPTLTPPPSKKIVIVPGLGASWNRDAIFNCKVSNYKGNWKLAFYAEKYYKPLYTVLSDEGYTISPYYYDWRKTVPTHANSLNTFIANITEDGEKINVLGHSMGGLLARSYLELVKEQNELSKFLSIGSPHRGVSSSYPAWSGGEIWEKDLLRRIAMTLAIKRCDFYENPRKNIQKFIPSIQNLLRIDDYLRSNATGQLKSVASMSAQNNWLPTQNFTPPFYGVTVGSLTGVDQQTLDVTKVKKRSAVDAILGNWADGKPISREYSLIGDDTVLAQSSDIPGSIITHIPQSHTGLIHSNDSYETILQFLEPNVTFKPVSSALLQKPTSAVIIIADPATAEAVSPDGVTQSSDDGTIAIYNPKSGNYKLKFSPKSTTTKVIVAQFLEDGRILWKEYNLTGSKAMQKSLQYNPLNPLEDALR